MNRAFIAETYLRLLADDPDPGAGTARYYIQTAARYGVPLERISELAHIPLNRVAVLAKET